MNTRNSNEPKNGREVMLMLTALIPIAAASLIVTALIRLMQGVPQWICEVVRFGGWAVIALLLVTGWGQLLRAIGILDADHQAKRFLFGLGIGGD